jgi:hypothetical protein
MFFSFFHFRFICKRKHRSRSFKTSATYKGNQALTATWTTKGNKDSHFHTQEFSAKTDGIGEDLGAEIRQTQQVKLSKRKSS